MVNKEPAHINIDEKIELLLENEERRIKLLKDIKNSSTITVLEEIGEEDVKNNNR